MKASEDGNRSGFADAASKEADRGFGIPWGLEALGSRDFP